MKPKDGKPTSQPEKGSSVVAMALLFVVLCSLSFYLGGIFCSQGWRYVTTDVAKALESPKQAAVSPLQINATSFAECSPDLQDYTPCTDPKVYLITIIMLSSQSLWLRFVII